MNTEIRFVDVDFLKVGKDFLQIEACELVKEEVEATLALQLQTCPLHLVHLTISIQVI